MKLTESVKEEILNYCRENDVTGMDIAEVNEEVLDFLIDEGHVDLSDDEDGDVYESLSNSVWEFIEENVELLYELSTTWSPL
jgi:hypothetical protein